MKNILVIGMGRFGIHVVQELSNLKCDIMAVDTSEVKLRNVSEYVTKTVIGNAADMEFMKTLGVNNFDDCIVAIGDNFQNSLLTVLNLKELGAKRITARAAFESQEILLQKIGADTIVYPEKQLAKQTALQCGTDSIYDFMDLDDDYGVYEMSVPEKWVGKTLMELDLRKKYNINIIGAKANAKIKMIFHSDFKLQANERLLVVAKSEDMQKILNIK